MCCDTGISARWVQRGERDILAEVRAVPEVDGRGVPEAAGAADLRRPRGRVERWSGERRRRRPSGGRASSVDGAGQPVRRRTAAGLLTHEVRPVPALRQDAAMRSGRRGCHAAAAVRAARPRRWRRREGATSVVAAAELAGGQATSNKYPRRGRRGWSNEHLSATSRWRRWTRERKWPYEVHQAAFTRRSQDARCPAIRTFTAEWQYRPAHGWAIDTRRRPPAAAPVDGDEAPLRTVQSNTSSATF